MTIDMRSYKLRRPHSLVAPRLVALLGRAGLDPTRGDEFVVLFVADLRQRLDDRFGVLTEERRSTRDPTRCPRHLPGHPGHRFTTDQWVLHIDEQIASPEVFV